jgi:hypothetical protein
LFINETKHSCLVEQIDRFSSLEHIGIKDDPKITNNSIAIHDNENISSHLLNHDNKYQRKILQYSNTNKVYVPESSNTSSIKSNPTKAGRNQTTPNEDQSN